MGGASEAPVTATQSGATQSGATQSGVKPDVTKRAIAAIIDGAIAGAVGLVPLVGGIVGALYILLRDGFDYEFMDGRSVGKKLMKLRPVRLDGAKMDLSTSARRNWPIALGSLASVLFILPVIGWILYIPVLILAIVLGIVEIVSVLTSPDGRRWGDKLANTKVVEVAD
jgi:uncharacterized RDD family membrane protein YckC